MTKSSPTIKLIPNLVNGYISYRPEVTDQNGSTRYPDISSGVWEKMQEQIRKMAQEMGYIVWDDGLTEGSPTLSAQHRCEGRNNVIVNQVRAAHREKNEALMIQAIDAVANYSPRAMAQWALEVSKGILEEAKGTLEEEDAS